VSTPQGPYGPQNPYGQQPAQGPYAGGPYGPYGQQPPAPQQPPYPQQQQQAYGGWGAPPMPPPPRKSRTGLVIGIVGGVAALVVAVVAGLAMLGSKVESNFPDAKFELTLPQKLLDGRYELTEDLSDTEGKKVEDGMKGAWAAKVTAAKVAQYGLGGDDTKGVLIISGVYGRFQNLRDGRESMLKGVTETDGLTVAVPAQDFRPSGSDTTITCEVVTQKASAVTVTYPVCAWADGNTAAVVAKMSASDVSKDASDVDMAAAAKVTLQVRSETRKAIG